VTEHFFNDDEHRKVWQYMVKHWQSYGLSPTVEVVADNYPAYEIEEPDEPVEYFIDSLAARRKMVMLQETISKAVEMISIDGVTKIDSVSTLLNQGLMSSIIETSPVLTVDYLVALKAAAEEWKQGVFNNGLSYGFPTLDEYTSGLMPEQYVVFTGLAKAKKSWTLLHCASTAQLQGGRVVFVTFEMSNVEQVERLATLWGKVPYRSVMKKTFTNADYANINKGIAVRKALHPLMGVQDTYGHSTVSSLQALVRSTNADVLCIDGIYLMTDDVTGDPGSSGTQPLTNISRALKRLAKTEKIGVVVTTQTLHSKTTKGRTNLFGMGYTSAFSQDADLVVGVESNPDNPKWSTMRILGNRAGPQGIEFDVSWDLDTGLVEEVGSDDDDNSLTFDEDEDDA